MLTTIAISVAAAALVSGVISYRAFCAMEKYVDDVVQKLKEIADLLIERKTDITEIKTKGR